MSVPHSITGLFVLLALAVACRSTPSAPNESETNSENAPARGLVPAKLTPELIEHSERILSEHADAPVGTNVPLRVNGRRYLARIELHEDEEKGKHKGVTLYELK